MADKKQEPKKKEEAKKAPAKRVPITKPGNKVKPSI